VALNAVAGDGTGHAVVTKRLTKRILSPTVYNLRGTAAPAVILEGGKLPPRRQSPWCSTNRARALIRS
jgi:hypothetical protein